eukprot:3384596-Alexandrium_andersonii.AAC.1
MAGSPGGLRPMREALFGVPRCTKHLHTICGFSHVPTSGHLATSCPEFGSRTAHVTQRALRDPPIICQR